MIPSSLAVLRPVGGYTTETVIVGKWSRRRDRVYRSALTPSLRLLNLVTVLSIVFPKHVSDVWLKRTRNVGRFTDLRPTMTMPTCVVEARVMVFGGNVVGCRLML